MALESAENYLKTLKNRGKKSRVYSRHQLIGLQVALLLDDEKHKSLYIKLAKEGDPQELIRLAKDVASRKRAKNKGGYFMKILKSAKH